MTGNTAARQRRAQTNVWTGPDAAFRKPEGARISKGTPQEKTVAVTKA